jgi:hypothetical protein
MILLLVDFGKHGSKSFGPLSKYSAASCLPLSLDEVDLKSLGVLLVAGILKALYSPLGRKDKKNKTQNTCVACTLHSLFLGYKL